MSRPFSVCAVSVAWMVLVGFLLGGCANIGMSHTPAVPEHTLFDQAVMAYARGELKEATGYLRDWHQAHPGDLRAQALVRAIAREEGAPADGWPAFTDMPVPQMLSPEDLTRFVLWRNPDIRQAVYRLIESRAALREANVSFSPEFLVLSRFYPSGIFVRLTQSILGALLERRALMDQSEADLLAAVARYAQVRDATLHQVMSTYLRWLESQEVVPVIQHAVDIGNELERVAAVLNDHELLAPAEFLALRREVNLLRQELADRQGHIRIAEVALKGFMAQPEDEKVTFTRAPLAVDSPETIADMVSAAHEHHPLLVEARGDVAAAKAQKDRLFWSLPKVDLRATYGDSDKKGRGDFIEDFSIGGRIRFPLLLWPLQRARSDREQAFIHSLEMEVLSLRNQVTLNIFQGYEDLQSAQSASQIVETEVLTRQEELKMLGAQGELGEEDNRLALLQGALHYWEGKKALVAQRFAIQQAQLQVRHAQGQALHQIAFTQEMEEDEERLMPVSLARLGRQGRGLWVWKPDFLKTAQARRFFVNFANARHFSTVFLSVSTKRLQRDPAGFRYFLRLAHARGLIVHALNGAPNWILPLSRRSATDFFAAIRDFHHSGNPDARFDAVHLDVEPHGLPAWKTGQRDALITQYLGFLAWADEQTQKSGLPLVVDIPDWYDRIPVGGTSLLDRVFSHADQIAVMAYRRNTAKLTQAIQEEIRLAQQQQRAMWIGLSADRRHLSSSVTWDVGMETPLDHSIWAVEAEVKPTHGLVNIAIHDYHRYRRLLLMAGPVPRSRTQAADMFSRVE